MSEIIFLVTGVLVGYFVFSPENPSNQIDWDGKCAICGKDVLWKEVGGVGQKSNDREASVSTMIYGHKKCLIPIGKEVLDQKGDLREFNNGDDNVVK